MDNTPANDRWTLDIALSYQNNTPETRIPITFLPTGEIDSKFTPPNYITFANSLLEPSIPEKGSV